MNETNKWIFLLGPKNDAVKSWGTHSRNTEVYKCKRWYSSVLLKITFWHISSSPKWTPAYVSVNCFSPFKIYETKSRVERHFLWEIQSKSLPKQTIQHESNLPVTNEEICVSFGISASFTNRWPMGCSNHYRYVLLQTPRDTKTNPFFFYAN